MTYEISPDRDIAFNFVNAQLGCGRTANQRGLSLIKDGEVIAGIVYDEFNGSNVFMHVAATPGRRWMTRAFLHNAFLYPFVQMGANRITGWVEADNLDARRFDEHLGFRPEAVLKGAGSKGQDVILYVMHREDCRYA